MILTGQVSKKSFKGFRFESYWLKIRGFSDVVRESWQAPVIHSDAMWRLNCKLSRLAKALRLWSRCRVGNIALLSAIAKQVILALDTAQDARDLMIAELGLRLFLRQKLLGLAAVQRIRIRQRSRILWLCPNHAKSKLFHIKANGRRRRNFIPLLETDSGQLTFQSDKQAELLRHIKNSIGAAPTRPYSIN